MKIIFNIHFITQWGELLQLIIKNPEKSGETELVNMICTKDFIWKTEINLSQPLNSFEYHYQLITADRQIIKEYSGFRKIQLPAKEPIIHLTDSWRASFGDTPFDTTVFKDIYFKRNAVDIQLNNEGIMSEVLNLSQWKKLQPIQVLNH